jgi:hypothetical protein
MSSDEVTSGMYDEAFKISGCYFVPCLVGSLSSQHGASSGCRWSNGLQQWRVAANILNKQPPTNDKGWSPSLGVERGANNPSP